MPLEGYPFFSAKRTETDRLLIVPNVFVKQIVKWGRMNDNYSRRLLFLSFYPFEIPKSSTLILPLTDAQELLQVQE